MTKRAGYDDEEAKCDTSNSTTSTVALNDRSNYMKGTILKMKLKDFMQFRDVTIEPGNVSLALCELSLNIDDINM